ncbi:MAG TPA: peptidase S8, partial [Blastocatellia bacterium]|nr:peptidase S8 [Blastocatellia bacterium]
MIRRLTFRTMILALALTMSAALAQAAKLSPALQTTLASAANNVSVGVVIVSFNTNGGLNDTHLAILRGLGISKGIRLNRLGMVAMPATAGQVRALAANSAVRSVWSNDRLYYFMNQARMLAGVDRLRQDTQFTLANGGLPVSGAGNFSVVIN